MIRVLAIAGPTASGKSELALAVADRVRGEIVSCDSVQVYRGFRIGCAKASAAEQAHVRHHVLDVAEWHEAFDAQRYRQLALAAIADIRARGGAPLVCGGTGLYLRGLRWGLVQLPAADPSLRRRLLTEETEQPGSLYARLQALDPASAAQIEPRNLLRVARALEITLTAGRPASAVRAEHGFAREQVPMRVVSLHWPDAELKTRIAARSAGMVAAGVVDEVQELLAAGVAPTCRPLAAVGYREALAVVQGEAPLVGLADRIAASTWAYARRQRTWLRKERDVEQVEMRDLNALAESLARALN